MLLSFTDEEIEAPRDRSPAQGHRAGMLELGLNPGVPGPELILLPTVWYSLTPPSPYMEGLLTRAQSENGGILFCVCI